MWLKKLILIFPTFLVLEIVVSQETYIFLITYGKFHSWKVFHLKDIIENVSG